MKTLGKVVWSAIVAAVIGVVVVTVLNRTLGEGWYRDLPGGSGVDPAPQGAGDAAHGCRQPGAETTGKLPKLPGDYSADVNPCLAFVDVLAKLGDLVPEPGDKVSNAEAGDEDKKQQVRAGRAKFHKGLDAAKRRLGTLVKAKDAVQCGYATDHLALALYQAKSPKWSAGVVAVVRGDIDAVTETGVCLLLRQIPGLTEDDQDQQPPPRVSFCFHSKRDGGYTWLWLGSTDKICSLFNGKLNGSATRDRDEDKADVALVWADPLKVRAGPHTKDKELGSLPFGTPVEIKCQIAGDPVKGVTGESIDVWVGIDYGSRKGYVSRAWLTSRDRQPVPEVEQAC